MKIKIAVLSLLISAVAASLCFAADDAFMGTWKLNEAKSKIGAGMPKNDTVVYAQSGDEVTITVDGTDGGKKVHHVWTGKFDRPLAEWDDPRIVHRGNQKAISAELN